MTEASGPVFQYHDLLPLNTTDGIEPTQYRQLSPGDDPEADWYTQEMDGPAQLVRVAPAALTRLAHEAMRDMAHLFRRSHLGQWRAVLEDPEASDNDRYVAFELLKNASISAGRVLPSCQDTGTATIVAKKGDHVWTGGGDRAALSRGVFQAYTGSYLRYSQMIPITVFEEKNSGTNLPAQIDIESVDGGQYKFLFLAKGGGSANKTFLFQQTRALLNPATLKKFLREQLMTLGTSACPPYHLAIVIGGLSAEMTLKTVKLASARYLDALPGRGDGVAAHGIRDREMEAEVLAMTRELGIGAQFGGRHFALDVRVIRLPRHGASCPVGIGLSCSADRNALGYIDRTGVWLEALETDPAQFLPDTPPQALSQEVVAIDLNQPMEQIRATLSRYPVKTRVMLSGPIVVARDIAHARIKEQLDRGEPLPESFRNHIVYYAGPAKTPPGYPSGAFGPTTAGRMDAYVDLFQANGGSYVMLAKGNRSRQVTDACQKHGGFYLGSIGGSAARLAHECIRSVEVIGFPDLGMEAIHRIEVQDFPAFIVVDDKGNDFFADYAH